MEITEKQALILIKEHEKIMDAADKLYLHGFRLKNFFNTKAFESMTKANGEGFCHEFATIAMILLKNYKTANLCRGDFYDDAGKFVTKHSWVEFEIPGLGTQIVDWAWLPNHIFVNKEDYHPHDGKLKERRRYSYEEFWRLPLAEETYSAMKTEDTSYIIFVLAEYVLPTNLPGDFKLSEELPDYTLAQIVKIPIPFGAFDEENPPV